MATHIEETFPNIRKLIDGISLKYESVQGIPMLTIPFKSGGKRISNMKVFDWIELRHIEILDSTIFSMKVIPFNEGNRPKPKLKNGFHVILCSENDHEIESTTDDILSTMYRPYEEYASIEKVVEYYNELCSNLY